MKALADKAVVEEGGKVLDNFTVRQGARGSAGEMGAGRADRVFDRGGGIGCPG